MAQLQQSQPVARPGWWYRLWAGDEARRQRAVAYRLYGAVVEQARNPVFYRTLGVPDTPEGRFEMIALHVGLVLRQLRAAGPEGQAVGQALFDLMFADMDMSLRELGVGDLSVGKHVKRLAGNFYARLAALDDALATADPTRFAPWLRTNVYHGAAPPGQAQLDALAGYLVEQDRHLAAQPRAGLLRGGPGFAAPVVPPSKPGDGKGIDRPPAPP